MSGLAERFRALLVEACLGLGPKPVVLLSGGLDSGCILAAMAASGRDDFAVATLRLGHEPTADERGAEARRAALAPLSPFHLCRVPADEGQALEQAGWAIRSSGAVLKTGIEVAVATRPMIRRLAGELGYRTLVNGMTGGLFWGLGKEQMMLLRREGHAAWVAQKRSWLAYEKAGYPPNGTRLCALAARQAGAGWEDPLAAPAVAELLLPLTYDELNRPQPKGLAVAAFPELAATPAVSGGLQVVAGVREFMAGVAQRRGHASALRLYGAMARAMGLSPKGSDGARAAWRGLDL